MNESLTPAPSPDYPQFESPMTADSAPASTFRWQKFLASLFKYWWVPLISVVVCTGATVGYLLTQPPTFVSKASMWETVKLRLPEGSLFEEDMQTFLGTQTELLQSTALKEQTLDRLRSNSNSVAIPLGSDGQPLPVTIRVTPAAKSAVFMIEANSSAPAYARAYLNALMDVYLEYKKNIRKVVSGDTLASITEQVQKTERDLKIEQDNLAAFQRSNNLAIVQEEGTVAGGYLAKLKTQLSDYELEDKLLKAAAADYDAANGATNSARFGWTGLAALSGTGQGSTGVSAPDAQVKELELLRMQRERLSENLRPKHPKIIQLDQEIVKGEKLMDMYRRQSREQLNSSREAVRLRIANVQSSIKEWEGRVVEANGRIAEAEQLKLNVQRQQGIYDRLLMLVQNVGISRNIDQETLAVLEPAASATRSYSKEKSLATTSFVGGLGFGLGIVFLIAWRDDRFTSVLEVTERLGDGVVGQVPEFLGADSTRPLLLENKEEHYMHSESYRSLRSAILFLATEGRRPKILLITSALPNEGKSTVSINLARTLALGGARVLLVDADLRKGALHELVGLKQEPGLTEALLHPELEHGVIQTNGLPNLSFIARGGSVANPGDLFLSRTLDQLLASWREQFDYVLIDTSPVFAADDASSLAPKTDGTLFVVRSRFSGARQVREALGLLSQRQARVLGLIFNRADTSSRSYHYYKYSDYYGARPK